MNYSLSDFAYSLPPDLIASVPLKDRAASRLLHLNRKTGACAHRQFANLIDYLNPNDLLVLNNTKVIPARCYGEKASGGKVEILIERIRDAHTAVAHLKANRKTPVHSCVYFSEGLEAIVASRQDDLFELVFNQPLLSWLNVHGHMPLPPYIKRAADKKDTERYQTVYAEQEGAVAAPTAGLHFNHYLLQQLKEKGVQTTTVTLHVGAGTFKPVKHENLDEHEMHTEWMSVSEEACRAVTQVRARGGRGIAVGTTSARALETAAQKGDLKPYEGETRLFIRPGFSFHVVEGLITNFHLPKSTLLMLVSAFAGYEATGKCYQAAIGERYRFYSYGDAMFID